MRREDMKGRAATSHFLGETMDKAGGMHTSISISHRLRTAEKRRLNSLAVLVFPVHNQRGFLCPEKVLRQKNAGADSGTLAQ